MFFFQQLLINHFEVALIMMEQTQFAFVFVVVDRLVVDQLDFKQPQRYFQRSFSSPYVQSWPEGNKYLKIHSELDSGGKSLNLQVHSTLIISEWFFGPSLDGLFYLIHLNISFHHVTIVAIYVLNKYYSWTAREIAL